MRVNVDSLAAFFAVIILYSIGYIFAFRHDMLRRVERTHHPSVSPIGRRNGLSYGPLFVVNGLVSMLVSFIPLHFFLVNISQGRCGVFINIPVTLAIIGATIAGTVSIFNPEKMLRLYVYTNTWIRKHVVKLSPPPPIPEEVYKKQMFNIRITGIAWLIAALTWSCILY